MRRLTITALICLVFATAGHAEDVGSLLARIKAVGREGRGNAAAAGAWKELARQGPGALPATLAGLDDADPTAANWLRAAVETVRDRARADGKALPADKLEAFVRDTRHAGPARRLAYDLLTEADPTAPDRLLPGMLSDPGQELRRDAVARALKEAQAGFDAKDPQAKTTHQKLLEHARDKDQLTQIADRLKALGAPVDLTAHYGFLTRWHVIGPFDNRKGVGFGTPYPPEKGVDRAAAYPGQDGKDVRWQPHTTKAPLGVVDFNKVIGPLKGTVAYAHAVVTAPTEMPVELRAGSNNAVRLYLNGREVYAREEYHHGMAMDQHVGRGTLKAGRNEILVKVCQNEQTDSWAQQWSFQLRVCDAIGGALPIVEEVPPARQK